MIRRLARRGFPLVVTSAFVLTAAACSILYRLDDNLGPVGDASPADAPSPPPDGTAAPDAAPATNWCATTAGPHTFCEDFDESTSPTPDGFKVACGMPGVAADAAICASPPNCLLAPNGGCVAISRTFPIAGQTRLTVNFWFRMDAHDAAALNKVADLELTTGTSTYTVGLTVQVHMNLFYVATDGDASFVPVLVASVPGNYFVSFTVDLGGKTANADINGTPASLTLGEPMPTPGQIQSVTLKVGIPDSTVGSGETVHVDNITLDLN